MLVILSNPKAKIVEDAKPDGEMQEFPGGAKRGSDEVLYSEVDKDFIYTVMNSQGIVDSTSYKWRSILNDLADMASSGVGGESTLMKCAYRIVYMCEITLFELRRLIALTMTEGAKKYGRDNWKTLREDGTPSIPVSCCLNHAIEHLVKYREMDTSENHLGHTLCNLYFAWWHLKNANENKSGAFSRFDCNLSKNPSIFVDSRNS
jgi:hypothetical protein